MNTVNISTGFSVSGGSYDAENPTKQTELLCSSLQTLLYNIGLSGGVIHIETVTPTQQNDAVETWLTDFKSWLSDCEGSISAWLLESEESRVLPVLLTAPAWPALVGAAAVMVYKGALIRAGVDGVTSLMRIVQQATANRRQGELVRLLDKALLKGSWFGLSKESNFDELEDLLRALNNSIGLVTDRLTVEGRAGNYQGIGQALYDCLSKYSRIDNLPDEGETVETVATLLERGLNKDGIIKLLSYINLTHGGQVEETEFVLAQAE